MGLYDRDYTQADFQSQNRYAPRMRIRLPRPSTVVGWLLAINTAVFVLDAAFLPKNVHFDSDTMTLLDKYFSVFPYSLLSALQPWRLVTYQFLHGGLWHLLFNMLWLYFVGPALERHWGARKFLRFYLGCGIAGGLFYLLLVGVGFLRIGWMVGASGSILGVFAACAILFPRFNVFLIPFPVAIPIRVAAIAGIVMYLLYVVGRAENAGGHAAHIAGMAAGAAYVFSESWRAKLRTKVRTDRWKRKMTEQRSIHAQLDQILEKVHNQGVHSLTRKEKNILKQATEAERRRNKV